MLFGLCPSIVGNRLSVCNLFGDLCPRSIHYYKVTSLLDTVCPLVLGRYVHMLLDLCPSIADYCQSVCYWVVYAYCPSVITWVSYITV